MASLYKLLHYDEKYKFSSMIVEWKYSLILNKLIKILRAFPINCYQSMDLKSLTSSII